MAASLAEKLRIKEGFILRTINGPAGFREDLGPLPTEVKISATAKNPNQVHWFVKDRKQMESEINLILPLIKQDRVCWIYFPKGGSKMQTDLTRDKGWDELMKHDFQWISLISFNDTWSAFGMRPKTSGDRKKEAAEPKQREVFNYVDPKTKTVHLPADLEAALEKAKKSARFFNELSFTNKKEYIEWVVSAKRKETRSGRIKETIARLEKGWKNPANR